MPSREVLQYYGMDSPWGRVRYGVRFLWRFFLDKVIFFCPVKPWRTAMHRWRGIKIGRGVYVGHEVLFDRVFPDLISIGDHSSVGDRCIITAHANIPSETPLKRIYPRKVMPTTIGRGVWLMPGVTVCPGVTIGDEAVVATGAVVTRDVPARTMVAGVPARVVKHLTLDDDGDEKE